MKSFKILSLAITLLISLATFGQEKDSINTKVKGLQITPNNKTTNTTIRLNCVEQKKNDNKNNALIIIDNRKSTAKRLSKIKPENIESVNVVKGITAVDLYGKKAENGAIIVITKNLTTKN